ncbi:isocitrate lyase/phosphoenolpyruvate mutase family protein [Bacillus thuringiensis]|uniref:isocitrate lyase/phosphoenolpyruvate mutase family protein n=1 Tax=Bacillus thuringiensis TaxID=1428 RepID=UPI0011AAC7F6|nr:isocitrate lyase/phosphoenolpyruvate mutase family protein [Bacillus thuringiensis]
MNKKAEIMRELIKEDGIKLGAGVHDALTAKIAEQVGFDFIWASGLGLSAVNSVPDASLLTFGDFLPNFSFISQAVEIPVIADCDNGYGDIANAVFTAKQLVSRTEIAGICIEDNPYPKRNSLVNGFERLLISKEEMANKISSIRDAIGQDLFIIARCESLIAGQSMELALERAGLYAKAGADAILIHTKDSSGSEAEKISGLWNEATPLVTVPTAFPQVSPTKLQELGYSIAIYANQPLRAAVAAVKDALFAIKEGKIMELEKNIVPLPELLKLTSLPYLSMYERETVYK